MSRSPILLPRRKCPSTPTDPALRKSNDQMAPRHLQRFLKRYNMPVFLNASDADFETRFKALLSAKREDSPDVDAVVSDIISDVRSRGDAAVIELTEKFDRVSLTPDQLRLSDSEIDQAVAEVPKTQLDALTLAADRIRAYHDRQVPV